MLCTMLIFAEEAAQVDKELVNTTAGAAWAAMVLAGLNGILLTVQMINNRKRDEFKSTLEAQIERDKQLVDIQREKDKALIETQREKDKREYDSTLIALKNKTNELEKQNKRCEEERIRDKEELKREIEIRDKRYDDIIRTILKREEEIEEWRKKQEQKVDKLVESDSGRILVPDSIKHTKNQGTNQ